MIDDEVLSKVKEGLRDAGADRVASSRDLSRECRLVEADFGDEVLITALFETPVEGEVLFKITPSSRIFFGTPSCNSVKYTPYGIYGFASMEELREEVRRVAEKVLRLARNVWVGGLV
ncbi:MAG: hypothetical protein J7L55_03505 [Desulfurococcales archaeon]|nr:hypothetical protein [Desulfurococcales archaeon]